MIVNGLYSIFFLSFFIVYPLTKGVNNQGNRYTAYDDGGYRYSNPGNQVGYYNTGKGHAFSTAKQGSKASGGVPYSQHYNYNQGFVTRKYHPDRARNANPQQNMTHGHANCATGSNLEPLGPRTTGTAHNQEFKKSNQVKSYSISSVYIRPRAAPFDIGYLVNKTEQLNIKESKK